MAPKRMVGGVPVQHSEELPGLVRSQLQGLGPWNHRDDMDCTDGLRLALDQAGSLAEDVARAVLAHMQDPNPKLRSGAVALAIPVAEILGIEEMVRLLRDRPELFQGVASQGIPSDHPDLSWPLLMAIGREAPADHEGARALLRQAASHPHGGKIIDDLARLDPEWVLAHPETVAPHRLRWVLAAMEAPHRRVLLEAKARALLESLARGEAVDLHPREEDYARVFTAEVADQARQAYTAIFSRMPAHPVPGPDQTRVHLVLATTEELHRTPGFPGGFARIQPLLAPGLHWVSWRFLAPGHTAGTSWTGLVWVVDHWAWLPKPWRALRPG